MADEDDEWKFSIDDVGEADENAGADEDAWGDVRDTDDERTVLGEDDDGPTVNFGGQSATEAAEAGESEGEGNVAGTLTPQIPVERETPSPENTLFVALGVLLTVLVIASVPLELDAVTVLAIAGIVAAVAGALYAFFRSF